MLNLNSLLLFSENPVALKEFYTKVLGKKPDWEMKDFCGFQVGASMLGIMVHDKVHGKNKDKNRIIFNFETKELDKEFKRIKNTGAKVIKEPYKMEEDGGDDMMISTFEDPDGNLFQVMTPPKI